MEYFKNPVTLKNNIKWISNQVTTKLERILKKKGIFQNPKIKQKKINNSSIDYLKIKDNDKYFFCKLVDKKFIDQEFKSFLINKYINNSKLVPVAYNFKKVLYNKKKKILFTYEFISGKKFLINKKNLNNIFLRLKILHKSLKKNITSKELIYESILREKKIKRNFNLIIKGNLKEKSDLVKCYHFFLESRQLVHGDLHLKNIIYNNKFFFIDFEETSRTFLNPKIDYINVLLNLLLTKKFKKISLVKFFYKKKLFNNFSLYILIKFIIYRNLSILKFYKDTHEKKREEKKFYKYLSFVDNIKLEINN